jgi:acyl-CoA thioesterase FadM
MTGSLTISYHRPTPLNTDLTLEAETTVVSDRKIRVVGRILCDGEVTAEGNGLFIRPKGGMLRV